VRPRRAVERWERARGSGTSPQRWSMTIDLDDVDFGSNRCVCPECGKEVPHAKRGVPCSETRCPSCGSMMKGRKCTEDKE
jgi:predicted amidophosphoribosyltransferase